MANNNNRMEAAGKQRKYHNTHLSIIYSCLYEQKQNEDKHERFRNVQS